METRGSEASFNPVVGITSRALILGSYPSPKSFEYGFYYGHPQNRFWPLIARLAGKPRPETIADKTALILASNLALWDSLKQCRITGASDASITDEDAVPNDIAGLMQQYPVEAVFCNGAASYRFYKRFCEKTTGLAALQLPSTSPANAAFSLDKLANQWQPLLKYMP